MKIILLFLFLLIATVSEGQKFWNIDCHTCKQLEGKECGVCNSVNEKEIFTGLIFTSGRNTKHIYKPFTTKIKNEIFTLRDYLGNQIKFELSNTQFTSDTLLTEFIRDCSCTKNAEINLDSILIEDTDTRIVCIEILPEIATLNDQDFALENSVIEEVAPNAFGFCADINSQGIVTATNIFLTELNKQYYIIFELLNGIPATETLSVNINDIEVLNILEPYNDGIHEVKFTGTGNDIIEFSVGGGSGNVCIVDIKVVEKISITGVHDVIGNHFYDENGTLLSPESFEFGRCHDAIDWLDILNVPDSIISDNQICSSYIYNDTLNLVLCDENGVTLHIFQTPISSKADSAGFVIITDSFGNEQFIPQDSLRELINTDHLLTEIDVINDTLRFIISDIGDDPDFIIDVDLSQYNETVTDLSISQRPNGDYELIYSDENNTTDSFVLSYNIIPTINPNEFQLVADSGIIANTFSVDWTRVTDNGDDTYSVTEPGGNAILIDAQIPETYELTQETGCIDSAAINLNDVTTVEFTTRITIKDPGDVIYYAIVYDGANVDLKPYNIYYRKDGIIVADDTKQEFFDAFFIEFGLTLPPVDLWSFSLNYENIFIPFVESGNHTALVSGFSTTMVSFALSNPGSSFGTFNDFNHLTLPLSLQLYDKSVDVYHFWGEDTTISTTQLFFEGILLEGSSYAKGACKGSPLYDFDCLNLSTQTLEVGYSNGFTLLNGILLPFDYEIISVSYNGPSDLTSIGFTIEIDGTTVQSYSNVFGSLNDSMSIFGLAGDTFNINVQNSGPVSDVHLMVCLKYFP